MPLSAEDLLAGSALTHDVAVPAALVGATAGTVRIRPLTVRDVQLIAHASKDDRELAAGLMIARAVVEPALTAEQAGRLPAGLARFLVDAVNELSGIDTPRDRLGELVQAPLAKACFVLADEFGWTAEDVTAMTIGQILMYLEMAGRAAEVA
ncbi:hypothetical protein [Pengzhenrongella sicca]|uniref:Uncharacterized protein n=1 Tax=Pengzhenrongella sicca TaxID=2819238 RepID=A0A8A4ZGN1_9MICO|nr:hypothetical protein [Pengzhenrongella sicca]QTE31200.1 hypothetical protein J4E96_09935 [Pengzhenrongella sicca]